MKNRSVQLGLSGLAVLFSASLAPMQAATLYVWTNSLYPSPPYNSWPNAARDIQTAVNAATNGDTVLATNGVYQTGGKILDGLGLLSNRVAIAKLITLRSVNGPAVTVINGAKAPGGGNGDGAARCVYLMDGAQLIGFTLNHGATRTTGDWPDCNGGGVLCHGANAIVSNCTFTSNSAFAYGGGGYGGTLNNCTLSGNSADNGGGAYVVTLYNCLLTGNAAGYGGGAYYSTLYNCTLAGNAAANDGGGACYGTLSNCIAWYNTAAQGTNTYEVAAAYSCAPDLSGGSNLSSNPLFLDAAAGNYRLHSNSPCVNAGQNQSWMADKLDLDGNPRIRDGLVDMGAYEYNPTAITVTPTRLNFGGVAVGSASDLVFRVQNFGEGTLSGLASAAAPFSVVSGTNYSLTINQFQSVIVRYSPTGVGNHSNTVTFTGGGGATRAVVGGTPVLWVTPSSLGFGLVSVGSSSERVFTAQNAGTGVLSGAAGVAAPFSIVSGGTYNLNPGQSQAVTVRFSPVWGGDASNNVTFTGGGGTSCPVTGSAPPITVTPAFRDFGTLDLGTYSNLTFTVRNTGFGALTGAAHVAGPFSILSGGSYNLATGQSQMIVVRFNPTTVGFHSNNVAFTGGGGTTRPVLGYSPILHYVWTNSPSPTAPYTSWSNAARTIQAAVDVAKSNELVLVTNGIYSTGSRVWPGEGTMNNRLIVTNGVAVRSVNGPAQTFIVGTGVTRCVYMTGGACLSGFTLTNGQSGSYGGGVYVAGSAVIGNCVLTGNSAAQYGGGTWNGTLNHCTLAGNSASWGGGTYGGTLNDCTLAGNSAANNGGGVYAGTLSNCTLSGNSASSGGGAMYGILYNCTLTGNSTLNYGGGAYRCALYNCTLAGNLAKYGGGTYQGTLNNCIAVGNYLTNGVVDNWTNALMNYTCTYPAPTNGIGNITNNPQFVDAGSGYGTNHLAGDYRLQSNSPCINTGTNQNWMVGALDLDGKLRISPFNGRVDMGAYEYQWGSVIPTNWLVRYGLKTDGSDDYEDPDGDRMNNWQEWRTDSNPTNADSFLGMAQPPGPRDPVSGEIVIRWQSSTACLYDVDRATNLMLGTFNRLRTNMPGLSGYTTYTDTTAIGSGPYSYWVWGGIAP